jgi:predicted ester cyclase
MKTKLLFQLALSVVWLCGCATNQDQSAQRNKEIIQRYFEGRANRGDTAVADELIETNVGLINLPAVVHGLKEDINGMTRFRAAFPDLRYTTEDLIAAGDKVVFHWTLRATHSGEYQGRPPTGKTIMVTGTSIFRIANAKIREITVNMDRLGMAQQLGWLPPPSKPPN